MCSRETFVRLCILTVFMGLLIFGVNSNAAKFDDFTFYNEYGLGAGTTTVEYSTSEVDFTGGVLDYRVGVREKYLYLVGAVRGVYNTSDVTDGVLGYKVGFGIGVEWDIPIRLYFGAFATGGGDMYDEWGSTSVSYDGGTITEISYFLNESSFVSLSIEKESLTVGTVEADSSSIIVSYTMQKDIDYPEVSWRRRMSSPDTPSSSEKLENDEEDTDIDEDFEDEEEDI